MNCIVARQYIQDELDGTLSRQDRSDLEEHLLVCPHCQGYRDSLQALSRSFASLPGVKAPAELMQRLGLEEGVRPRFNRKALLPLGIAAALLIGWGGWNVSHKPAVEELSAQQPAAESLYVWLTSYEEETESW